MTMEIVEMYIKNPNHKPPCALNQTILLQTNTANFQQALE